MDKDLELQIEINYGDICIERIISSKTTIRIGAENIQLNAEQIMQLHKALTAYVKADS